MSIQYAHQGRFRNDGAMTPAAPGRRQPFYSLTLRQQPEKARVVVRGKEKDRKPIDPPPIVQFHAEDEHSALCPFLHNPYYFCCCTLWDEKMDKPAQAEDRPGAVKELLVGQVVSSLHRLKDFNNEETAYYVFGDVSVAVLGKYRLRFSAYEFMPRTGEAILLQESVSEVFEVVSPKDWDGVRESTALSRAFADQGVRLRLRKESTKRAYGQSGAGSSTGPQTPLRPHPSHPGSYGSPSDHEQDASSEPTFKRQKSFQSSSGYHTSSSQGWQPTNYGTAAGPSSHQSHTPTSHASYASSGYQPGATGSYAQQPNPYGQYGHASGYRPQQSGDSYYHPSYPSSGGQTPSTSQAQQYTPQSSASYLQSQQGYPTSSGAYYSNPSYVTLPTKYPTATPNYNSGQTSSQPIPYGSYGSTPHGQESPASSQYSQYPSSSASYPYRQQQMPGQQYPQQQGLEQQQQQHSMANPSTTPRLAPINRGSGSEGSNVSTNDPYNQNRQQRLPSSSGPLPTPPY